MKRVGWLHKALMVLSASALTAGCTIQVGVPGSQQAETTVTPETSTSPTPQIPEACDQVYELVIADGSPGTSNDLAVASQAFREAAAASLGAPETSQLGNNLDGMRQILDKLIEAESQGIVHDEAVGAQLTQAVSGALGLVFDSFEDTCMR